MNGRKITRMTALALGALALASFGRGFQGAGPGQEEPLVRFEAIDVFVDSGEAALAAWQIELSDRLDRTRIVGVEGGEHPAFEEPPHYDPRALLQGRIIVAAFQTRGELPEGRTRVARIHVRVEGPAEPQYELELQVAAGRDGSAVEASASIGN